MSDTPRKDFEKALFACVEYRAKLDELERENADIQMSLRNWIDKCAAQAIRLGDLERENAALRADKERLDWLEFNLYTLWASGLRCNEFPAVEISARSGRFEAESIRAAIDAARKEAQP